MRRTPLYQRSINARVTATSTLAIARYRLTNAKPTPNQRWCQRCTALATPGFSICFPILCALTSVNERLSLFSTAPATLKQRSGGVTGP